MADLGRWRKGGGANHVEPLNALGTNERESFNSLDQGSLAAWSEAIFLSSEILGSRRNLREGK